MEATGGRPAPQPGRGDETRHLVARPPPLRQGDELFGADVGSNVIGNAHRPSCRVLPDPVLSNPADTATLHHAERGHIEQIAQAPSGAGIGNSAYAETVGRAWSASDEAAPGRNTGRGGAGCDAKFAVDRLQVVVDGPAAEAEPRGDVGVREPVRHQP